MSEESRGNVRIRTPPEEQILQRGSKSSSPATSGSKHGSQDQDSGSPKMERDGVTISDDAETDGEDVPFPGLYDKIFHCMKQTSYPRFWCIQLVCWPWFERISMMVIILNCITLGMYQPCNDIECDSQRCLVLQGFDHFIFAFFAVEMVIKIMAMGVTGKQGYLGETWNRLDCFIVIAGVLEYSLNLDNVNLSAIRTIRVLRPLRAINRIPSLRILVMLLLDTLPMLGNVLMLCFFVFFIFGIIGVQLWKGLLRNRCYLELGNFTNTSRDGYPNLTEFYRELEPFTDYVCSLPKDNGMRSCSDRKPFFEFNGMTCNGSAIEGDNSYYSNASECIDWNQYYTRCGVSDENPFLNSISFDNILYAWIAIFQVITLEGWVDIQYHLQDVHSPWIWIYYVFLIIIGAFFLINLCLVVIATQFSETKQRECKLMEEQRKRFRSSSTLASNSEMGSCYDEILKYIGHLVRRAKRRFRRWRKRMQSKRQRKVMPAISLRRKKKRTKSVHLHHHLHHHHHYHFGNGSQAPRASPEDSDVSSSPSRKNKLALPSSNGSATSLHSMNYCTEQIARLEPLPVRPGPLSSPYHMTTTLSIHRASSINYPNTNSKDLAQTVAFKMAADREGVTPTPGDASPGRFQEKFHELCGGNYISKYSKLPPIKTDVGKDALSPTGHPPLAQRLSAPPLTQPSSPTNNSSHLSPNSCHNMHSSCPVHQPCPVHTPCNSIPCPTHSPCYSKMAHSCPHVCTSEHHSSEYEWSNSSSSSSSEDGDSDSDSDSKSEYKVRQRGRGGFLGQVTSKVQEIVESKYFMRGILICILVNTLSMGIEYHGQPEELTEAIEISNLIFTSLFALEMLLKLVAYGPIGYISNGFNVFDGLIVIVSVVEVLQEGSGGLSVLRTFRLLRILKLVRFMPALRRQLLVMLRTMDNVATFFSLLALFIFIFSILGMHIFGCKFCDYVDGERVCDRKNFDSLLWAIVTVFQILTQEDWNIVLYNGMSRTSPWAALYFIALMTFGNYVLFNLLVAILVEGFSAEPEQKEANQAMKRDSENEEDDDDDDKKENENEDEKNQDDMKDDVVSVASDKENAGKLALPAPEGKTQGTNMPLGPPIITHTAATPQGSPNVDLQRAFRGNFADDTRSWDSDSQSLSSLSIRGSPRLPRSPSARSMNGRRGGSEKSPSSQGSKQGGNYLVPYQPGEELGQDSDSHSSVSISRSSLHDGSQNGYLPDSDINDSRRTSYISCNGGSITAIPQTDTQIPLGGGDDKDQQTEGTHPETYSNIEDPDALDEAKNTVQNCKKGNATSTFGDKHDADVDSDDGHDTGASGCCCCRCCPEPRGCFKTRQEYSLYLLSPRNKLRRKLQHLIAQKWFDYAILIIIFLNCVTLAMERPGIEPDSVERKFLTISNYVFMGIFTVEMAVKVLAKGFIFGTHAYLHSGWNVMDGSLVIISWIDLIITLVSSSSPEIFSILRVFRLLRTLRPLRVISRAPGLKLVVQTLLSSLRPIGNIVIICCTFFIIFGILGIQLFKGQFYYCSGPDIRDIRNRTQCKANPENVWTNQQYNFDNLAQALVALFVLASRDGWVDIMYNGIDAVGVDLQPKRDHNEWLILYFISFLLIVGFFVLNMFVGVVVENFHKCREEQAAEEMASRLLKRQSKLKKARQRAMEQPYYIHYSKARMMIHDIVMNKYFDLVVAAIIFLNVITMAMEFYLMPEILIDILTYFNYFFTAVFILEAILKMIALSVLRYLKDGWNQLDLIICILSIAGIVLEELESDIIPINPTIIRIMRVLRIARVLKLLKMAKGIRALLDTVFQALPQVGNLGLLFFLLFFIYAALGVELFGLLDCTDDNPCEGLGRHASFKNFFIAFLTLFRIATGDNWNGIMKDTLRQETCDKSAGCKSNCCANQYLAPMYFFSFVLIAQFVLVNVVVAVLMKHLEESHKLEQDDEEDAQIIADTLRQDAQDAADAAAARERDEAGDNSDDGEQETALTPLLKVTTSNPEIPASKAEHRNEQMDNPGQHLVVKQPVTRVKSLPDDFQFASDGGYVNKDKTDDEENDSTDSDGDRVLAVPQMYLKPTESALAAQQTSPADTVSVPPGHHKDTSSPALTKPSQSTFGGLGVPGREHEREGSPNPQRKAAARQLNPMGRTSTLPDDAGGGDGVPLSGTKGAEEVPLQEWRVPPVVVSSTSSEDDSQKLKKPQPDSPVKRAQRNRTSPTKSSRKTSPKKSNQRGSKNGSSDNVAEKRSDSLLSVESGCSSDNDSLLSSPQIRHRKSRRRSLASNASSSSTSLKSNPRSGSDDSSSKRTPPLAMRHSNPMLREPNGQTNSERMGSQNSSPRVGNGTQNGKAAATPTVHVEDTSRNAPPRDPHV